MREAMGKALDALTDWAKERNAEKEIERRSRRRPAKGGMRAKNAAPRPAPRTDPPKPPTKKLVTATPPVTALTEEYVLKFQRLVNRDGSTSLVFIP